MTWGKKQWLTGLLGFIPLVLFFFWFNFSLFRRHDFAGEIQASLQETRVAKDRVDVVGTLKNVGSHTWNRVTIEAEFYDPEGKFLDEKSEYLSITLAPGTEEHFRLSLTKSEAVAALANAKTVLKVTGADEARF